MNIWNVVIFISTVILECSRHSDCAYTVTSLQTITECEGANVIANFNWTYSPPADPNTISWTKRNPDGTKNATVATFSFGTFQVDAAYTGRVTRVENGHIQLKDLAVGDAGTYRIEVFDLSDLQTTQASGQLTVNKSPAGVLNGTNTTSNGIEILTVASLTSLGIPEVNVIVTDPDGNDIYFKKPPFTYNFTAATYPRGKYSIRVNGTATECLSAGNALKIPFDIFFHGKNPIPTPTDSTSPSTSSSSIPSSTPGPGPSKWKWWYYLLIAVGAIILILVIIICCCRRRRKQKTDHKKDKEKSDHFPSTEDKNNVLVVSESL